MRHLVILSILLAGCSAPEPAAVQETPMGDIHGWVYDHTVAPVEGAEVRIEGLGQTVTDAEGFFRIQAPLERDEYVIVARAPGFQAATSVVQVQRVEQSIEALLQVLPVPESGYTRLQTFQGLIACEAVAQVGHSHGTGDPDEDDRVACPVSLNEKRVFPLATESDPTDMLIEVVWRPSTPKAEYLTFALFDDEGEVIVFAEGTSILRMEIGRLIVQDYFGAGRQATLKAYTGIAEDDSTEVFVGLSIDQEFEVFVTTFYGQDMPRGYTVG